MKPSKLNLVYFSATYTTQKVMRAIAQGFGDIDVHEYDVTNGYDRDVTFAKDEIVIIGTPSYSGRMPNIAVEALNKFKGCYSPTILICVYGNRDYDDTLLELKSLTQTNCFKPFAAGVFIAQHSIFPTIGTGRPNADDIYMAHDFGTKCNELLQKIENIGLLGELYVKGNIPYRRVSNIPLKPNGSNKCDACGLCVKNCPTQAISIEKPRKTNKEKCISCGRCIRKCPTQARQFSGLLYWAVSRKFNKAYSAPKNNEVFFSESI